MVQTEHNINISSSHKLLTLCDSIFSSFGDEFQATFFCVCGCLTWHPRAALRNPRTLGEVGAAPVIIILNLPPRLACSDKNIISTGQQQVEIIIMATVQLTHLQES